METRANHLLVGSFVLLMIAGLFVFSIWLARANIDKDFAYYDVYFEDSVAGLRVGGSVEYRGIGVGRVDHINVDPADPSRVKVSLEIDEDIVIREGDRASLKIQGITGIAYINIEGATALSSVLIAKRDEDNPVIPSRRSQIQQLVRGAPELLTSSTLLVERVGKLVDDQNRRALAKILADVSLITGTFAARRDDLDSLLDRLVRSSTELESGARALRTAADGTGQLLDQAQKTLAVAHRAAEGADTMIQKDFKRLVSEFRYTLGSVSRVATTADKILADSREPLQAFTSEGLNDFSHLIAEARLLVIGLSRVTERIETDGARFLFGERESEFEAK